MTQIMSEEEAGGKACPYAKDFNADTLAGRGLEMLPRPPHCIGSNCMGWDWSDGEIQTKQYYAAGKVWAVYEKEQEEAGWTLVMNGSMRSHWTKPLEQPRRGFCGMIPQVFAQVEVS